MNHSQTFLNDVSRIAAEIDDLAVEDLVNHLVQLKNRNGRLFFLGLGGSAANCSHAVNDFRKIAGIQAFTPVDNVAELTARINDEGWASLFVNWLRMSGLSANDALFILSVGGGDLAQQISPNLVYAINYAQKIGTGVYGIVGRENGHTAQRATVCITIPAIRPDGITPYTESFQSVLLHLIVTHPKFGSTYSEKNTEKNLGRA